MTLQTPKVTLYHPPVVSSEKRTYLSEKADIEKTEERPSENELGGAPIHINIPADYFISYYIHALETSFFSGSESANKNEGLNGGKKEHRQKNEVGGLDSDRAAPAAFSCGTWCKPHKLLVKLITKSSRNKYYRRIRS